MIKDVLSHLGGVGVYGAITVTLFFVVFVGVLVWTWRLKPDDVDRMSRLPLEDSGTADPGPSRSPRSVAMAVPPSDSSHE